MVYPDKISVRLSSLRHARSPAQTSAAGVAVSFCCGSFLRYALSVTEDSSITEVSFNSNGCGYMLAAADVLADELTNHELVELHGLDDAQLRIRVDDALGNIKAGRRECVDTCIQSLHSALTALRAARIEEFSGEKALICTCFGVTEERIEAIVRSGTVATVDDVSAECNAGLGCGSCRMMIEEMIDSASELT